MTPQLSVSPQGRSVAASDPGATLSQAQVATLSDGTNRAAEANSSPMSGIHRLGMHDDDMHDIGGWNDSEGDQLQMETDDEETEDQVNQAGPAPLALGAGAGAGAARSHQLAHKPNIRGEVDMEELEELDATVPIAVGRRRIQKTLVDNKTEISSQEMKIQTDLQYSPESNIIKYARHVNSNPENALEVLEPLQEEEKEEEEENAASGTNNSGKKSRAKVQPRTKRRSGYSYFRSQPAIRTQAIKQLIPPLNERWKSTSIFSATLLDPSSDGTRKATATARDGVLSTMPTVVAGWAKWMQKVCPEGSVPSAPTPTSAAENDGVETTSNLQDANKFLSPLIGGNQPVFASPDGVDPDQTPAPFVPGPGMLTTTPGIDGSPIDAAAVAAGAGATAPGEELGVRAGNRVKGKHSGSVDDEDDEDDDNEEGYDSEELEPEVGRAGASSPGGSSRYGPADIEEEIDFELRRRSLPWSNRRLLEKASSSPVKAIGSSSPSSAMQDKSRQGALSPRELLASPTNSALDDASILEAFEPSRNEFYNSTIPSGNAELEALEHKSFYWHMHELTNDDHELEFISTVVYGTLGFGTNVVFKRMHFSPTPAAGLKPRCIHVI
jgi:hypothetical protein